MTFPRNKWLFHVKIFHHFHNATVRCGLSFFFLQQQKFLCKWQNRLLCKKSLNYKLITAGGSVLQLIKICWTSVPGVLPKPFLRNYALGNFLFAIIDKQKSYKPTVLKIITVHYLLTSHHLLLNRCLSFV